MNNITTGKNVEKIIKECDKNNDGEIDYKEFLDAMGLTRWYACYLILDFVCFDWNSWKLFTESINEILISFWGSFYQNCC